MIGAGVIRNIRSKWLERQIKRGNAPRGRTNMQEPRGPLQGNMEVQSLLTAKHLRDRGDGVYEEIDRRVEANRCVTTVFVNEVVDELQSATGISDYKYHDSGTGTDAEAAASTALQTPCGEARDTGSQTEGAANVYESVATHTYAGTFAITEHGVFDTNAAGNLMDRTLFSAINVISGDKIEFTYDLTFAAGS